MLPPAIQPATMIDRSLLSRVADSLYWMSRYVERAEHVARSLKITTNLLMDVGDLGEMMLDRQWKSLLQLSGNYADPPGTGSLGDRVPHWLTFDPANPISLSSCITSARENARAIRSEISAEMWENINSLYWSIHSNDTHARFEEQPEEIYSATIVGSMLFQGVTDQTLDHDQRWRFVQLAKSLERIDITCRIIEARYDAIQDAQAVLELPLRNILWMSLLRMCCSIEAFRRQYSSDLDPLTVVGFLLLEDDFPRSIRFNVTQALQSIASIRQATSPNATDPAERILGRLAAQLTYATEEEIDAQGVKSYLRQILLEVQSASVAVQQTYFSK